MNAKEIFEKLVERAIMRVSSSLKRKSGKPGEIIEKLPFDEREELQKLTSEDVKEAERNHLIYMIGDYPESTTTIHTHSIKEKNEQRDE